MRDIKQTTDGVGVGSTHKSAPWYERVTQYPSNLCSNLRFYSFARCRFVYAISSFDRNKTTCVFCNFACFLGDQSSQLYVYLLNLKGKTLFKNRPSQCNIARDFEHCCACILNELALSQSINTGCSRSR